jgi:hypothetical protein
MHQQWLVRLHRNGELLQVCADTEESLLHTLGWRLAGGRVDKADVDIFRIDQLYPGDVVKVFPDKKGERS